MKLSESKLRTIIREELSKLAEDAKESERIYNEIADYLQRNGKRVDGGYEIGNIVVDVQGREPIRVRWAHQPGGRYINHVKIHGDGRLEFIGAGGATPRSMPDYYDNPETVIELLQGDKRTVSNYPT